MSSPGNPQGPVSSPAGADPWRRIRRCCSEPSGRSRTSPPRRIRAPLRRRATCHGFTFVELLATIVLLGVVVPVALQGVSLATRVASHSKRQAEAANLCRLKLTELTAGGDWESGTQGGDFGTDWPAYEWTAELSNWTDATLQQLDVRVMWNAAGVERSVTLSTLVYPEAN